jgi:HEPN domain-containing protein
MARKRFTGVSEHEKAARHRLEDARALFEKKRWRGSMYMGGYAVECLLKAKLMRTFECRKLDEFEDRLRERGILPEHGSVYTHHLELLTRLTGGIDRLRRDATNWRMFTLANQWVPAWRYSANRSKKEDAENFLEAVERTTHWIEHNL